MRVALRGSYIDYVLFMGVNEKYPKWFQKELNRCTYTDESRFTFWVNQEERRPDYYEKQLIEDYTVILRKSNGEVFITSYDVFNTLYVTFIYDAFTSSGMAALEEDCIEYVECKGGVLPAGYPSWFYEHFTEAINLPQGEETIYLYDTDKHRITTSKGSMFEANMGGDISVSTHCVFLRNRLNEIRGMEYKEFLRYYDPEPNRRAKQYER